MADFTAPKEKGAGWLEIGGTSRCLTFPYAVALKPDPMKKVLTVAGWLACVASLCLALVGAWSGLVMWPSLGLFSVGHLIVLSVTCAISFVQLWAVLKKNFVLSLCLFGIQVTGLLVLSSGYIDFGPSLCSWGPHQGLIDCGL